MKRSIIAGSIAAAMLLAPMAPAANAATVVPTANVAAAASLPTIFPRVSWHWWGVSYHYTKTQTKMIAAGAGAAAGVYLGGLLAGEALIGGAAGLGAVGSYANDAVDAGNCLRLDLPWSIGYSISDASAHIEHC